MSIPRRACGGRRTALSRAFVLWYGQRMAPLPPAEFDAVWKDGLELGLELFLAWELADIHAAVDWKQDHEFLDQELQKLAPEGSEGVRRVDKLVKLIRHNGDPLYLHIEA